MSETLQVNEPEARTETGEIKDQSPMTTTETPSPSPEPEKSTTETKAPVDKPTLLNEKEAEAAGKKTDKDGPPEKYEFKLPEGFEMPEERTKEVSALFKDLGLSQTAGQKLMDYYAKQAIASAEAPFKVWQETQDKWVNEVKADPEIGSRLGEVKSTVAKAIDSLGDPKLAASFREAMDYTGAGNNPAFIKAFFKLAQRITEGGHVAGNAPSKFGQMAPGTSEKPTIAKAIYPNLP